MSYGAALSERVLRASRAPGKDLQWFLGRVVRNFNFHLVDEDKETGFAIYRMSAPIAEDMEVIHEHGISQIIVLSNNSSEFEDVYNTGPSLDVRNFNQTTREQITKEFLDQFDCFVEEAKKSGKKLAFRCQIGCHRTGRLAAYYEMKYMGFSLEEALVNYYKHGALNDILHPQVRRQIASLFRYIHGEQQEDDPYFVK